jgi:hypothetical protein
MQMCCHSLHQLLSSTKTSIESVISCLTLTYVLTSLRLPQFFKTRSVVKQLGAGGSLSSINLNHKTFTDVVQFVLLEKGARVEVYAGAGTHWTLVKTGSPGNVQAFVDLLASASGYDDTATAASVCVLGPVVGLCVASTCHRTLSLCQFSGEAVRGVADDAADAMTHELESSLTQFNVREVLWQKCECTQHTDAR